MTKMEYRDQFYWILEQFEAMGATPLQLLEEWFLMKEDISRFHYNVWLLS